MPANVQAADNPRSSASSVLTIEFYVFSSWISKFLYKFEDLIQNSQLDLMKFHSTSSDNMAYTLCWGSVRLPVVWEIWHPDSAILGRWGAMQSDFHMFDQQVAGCDKDNGLLL